MDKNHVNSFSESQVLVSMNFAFMNSCFFAKQMPTRRRRHWLRVSEIEGVFNGIELFVCKLCVLWCVDLPDLGWSHRSHQKFRRAKGLWPMGCPTVGSQYVRDWSKFKHLRSFPTPPSSTSTKKMTSKKKLTTPKLVDMSIVSPKHVATNFQETQAIFTGLTWLF